jgi:ComF family protein
VLAGPHYGPTLERIVRAFKYEGSRALAPWLAALLPDPPAHEGPWSRERVLVPVPLHPARRAARSFDQALLLADLVSRRSGIPVVEALERIRDTAPQARLGPDRRHANIRDAFRAIRPELVRGRPVLLLDDVVTTGSTLLEAADVLEGAGAGWILALTAAHGGTDDPAEEAIQGAVATTREVW